jgi:hypothetical protein
MLGGRRRAWLSHAPALAVVVGFVALAAVLTIDVGGLDTTEQAVRELGRGVLAGVLLFAVAGYALTERLVPAPVAPLRLLLVLPVGAAVSSLGLTVLGFAHLPIVASIGAVFAAGLFAAWRVPRRLRRRQHDRRAVGFAVIGAVVVVLALVPSLRAGYATVPGQNPDAHLVTGIAVLLQRAPPTATRAELAIPKMPKVWRSKYPIFYSLAAVAKLSRLEPFQAFPAVVALLAAFVAVGLGVFAVCVLGLSLEGGLLVAALAGLDFVLLHVTLHPYWNQLWGLAAFPFALLFAWFAIANRDARATGLFVLVLALGAFAYPLMLPYPLLALVAFAFALRRRLPVPHWSRRRWAVTLGAAAVVLAVPLVGVVEKVAEGVSEVIHPAGEAWRGDVTIFLPLGDFVGTGGGVLPLLAVTVFALIGLIWKLPRPQAAGLAAVLAVSVLLDVRLRLSPVATYVDFKHLTFVGLLVLPLAVAGAIWLIERRRAWAVAGMAGLLGLVGAAAVKARDELASTHEQVTTSMLELRAWSAALPPAASVRLDLPQSGYQAWAADFLHPHPLVSPNPLHGAVNPHVRYGVRAQYSLALTPGLNRSFTKSYVKVPVARDVVEPPVRSNAQFVLRKIR